MDDDIHFPETRFPDTAFPLAAHAGLADAQMRRNVRKATTTIRAKTDRVTAELPDWQDLRSAGAARKADALAGLDTHLLALEAAVTAAGGTVHWARDAAEARAIVTDLARASGAREAIKVKSMTTDEIDLNPALEAAGITPHETDLADMVVQLGNDTPSHIVVPAIHRNRAEIRQIFRARMGRDDIADDPPALTAAARSYLRPKFLSVDLAISGANFAIAETGAVCVVESEGNGRMCLSLSRTLITIMGIEKVIPRLADLGVFLQLLPRASTGERMNPYTSLWTGVTPGDGPQDFHLVLLDNGRSRILADPVARETLHCIRCSRCLNFCPVYEHTGGHAYRSMYQGPIGAILTPQLRDGGDSLPFASSLCGACHEVCPVKINIPRILVHLRGTIVSRRRAQSALPDAEALAMRAAGLALARPRLMRALAATGRIAQRVVIRDRRHPPAVIGALPLPGPLGAWTQTRDAPPLPQESFRDWWARRGEGGS